MSQQSKPARTAAAVVESNFSAREAWKQPAVFVPALLLAVCLLIAAILAGSALSRANGAETTLASVRNELTTTNGTLTTAQNDLVKANEAKTAAEAARANSDGQVTALQARVDTAELNAQTANDKRIAAEAKVAGLEGQIKSLNGQVISLGNERDNANAANNQAQIELNNTIAISDDLALQLGDLQTRFDEQATMVISLTAQLDAANAKIAQLTAKPAPAAQAQQPVALPTLVFRKECSGCEFQSSIRVSLNSSVAARGWFAKIDGTKIRCNLVAKDGVYQCLLNGVQARQNVTISVYASDGRGIPGGTGIPAAGGDNMKAERK